MVALVCVGALSLSATACAPTDAKPTPTPTKTAIFASEDEALQAAVDVYQQYNAAFFEMTSDEDISSDKLKPILSEPFFKELTSDTYLDDKNQYTKGIPSFNSASVVSLDQDDDSVKMRIKLCQDVTNVQIMDENGNDVTPSDRTDVFPVEIALSWETKSEQLIIEDEGSWQGDDFCTS